MMLSNHLIQCCPLLVLLWFWNKNQNSHHSLWGPVEVFTLFLPHGSLFTTPSHWPREVFLAICTLCLLPLHHRLLFTLEFSLNCHFLGEVFPGFQTRSSPIFIALLWAQIPLLYSAYHSCDFKLIWMIIWLMSSHPTKQSWWRQDTVQTIPLAKWMNKWMINLQGPSIDDSSGCHSRDPSWGQDNHKVIGLGRKKSGWRIKPQPKVPGRLKGYSPAAKAHGSQASAEARTACTWELITQHLP